MPRRDAAFYSDFSGRCRRHAALLAGTSALALLAYTMPVEARCLFCGAAGGTSATIAAMTSAITNAQQASQVSQAAEQSLTRAAQAIQAMQAAQNAARATAQGVPHSGTLNLNVPDGLTPGGLVPNMAAGWSGVNAPTQSTSGGQTVVGIQQTAPQAILNWLTFNVGARTTVDFNQQGNSNWVALNMIAATGVPSQILGQIKADGQVYLINPNGIIFGGASQINVGTLIASSASISASQFVNNGIYSTQTGGTYTPSFTNAGGPIIVEPGALITTSAPSSVTAGGGFVLMMGTQVRNGGTITTPQGQTELAAGDNFLIRPGYGTNANSWSTTRGNEIAVQLNVSGSSLTGGSGLVRNDGYIEADTGDITLAGETVVQNGTLISTTSVNVRGTVHLLSSASDSNGSVTLTANSFIGILPDSSGATALDSQRAALISDSATQDTNRATDASIQLGHQFDDLSSLADLEDESRVEIVSGGAVHFQNGSLTLANGGQVAVSATNRVQVDSGASIDVSGLLNVSLPMSANNIAVNIQGNELRDSPLNRDLGTLFNSAVYVDARDLVLVPAGTDGYPTDRYYTAGGLLEVSGELGNMPHTIGEWMALGGTIALSTGANGAVVAQPGSVFNISGGSIQYQSGGLNMSYLLGSNGRIYTVNNAPSYLTYTLYSGFTVDHSRWGVTEVYADPFRPAQIYQQGYTVGRDAGSLILSTPTSIFEGAVEAEIIDGERQTAARPANVTDGYLLTQTTVPLQGSLSLFNAPNAVATVAGSVGLVAAFSTDVRVADDVAPVAATLSFNSAIPTDRIDTAWFDAGQINSFDLGGLLLASTNKVTISAPLTLAAGGHAVFAAPSTEIAADVTIPGGSITAGGLLQYVLPGRATSFTILIASAGAVSVDPNVTLDLRGLWTNALLAPDDLTGEAFVNGGTVLFQGSITLGKGSVIDTSSGAAIMLNRKVIGGQGGNITLGAEIYNGTVLGGGLGLGSGALYSYGVAGGGALTIQSSGQVQITGDDSVSGVGVLHPDFFTHGFSKYDIDAIGGITVADNTVVNVVEPVYQLNAGWLASPTGTDPAVALGAPVLPPLFLGNPVTATLTQRAGASLRLSAGPFQAGFTQGSSVTVGEGAVLQVDPLQSIALESYGQLTVDGSLIAHGGAIKLVDDQLGSANSLLGANALDRVATFVPGLSIWIGSNALIDASGIAVQETDVNGNRYGTVLAGGSITVGGDGMTRVSGGDAALMAPILVRPGAVLDVSGASTVIDVNTGFKLSSRSGSALPIASDAGSMTFSSYFGVYLDGTLRAQAGGPNAAGGSLTVILRDGYPGQIQTPQPGLGQADIVIDQTYRQTNFDPSLQAGQCFLGCVANQANPPADFTPGHAALNIVHIGVDMLQNGGFDSLSLVSDNNILLNGAVNLRLGRSVTLGGGMIADVDPTANVIVSAPYIAMGQSFGSSTGFANITAGSGALTFNADQIDVTGFLQFGLTNSFLSPSLVIFNSQGDIRFGNATLTTGGDLTLTAAQIYPTTGSSASVNVGQRNAGNFPISGTLTINSVGDTPDFPMSVLGSLVLNASVINQGGVLRAPEGSLSLSANTVNLLPGSLTSISLEGATIPFGGTIDGVNWTAPVDMTLGGSTNFSRGPSLTIQGQLAVSQGAVLNLSGGGTLAGAGFISGRGGSTDTRFAALFPKQSTGIYAIIPGYDSGYAPTASINSSAAYPGSIPGVGATITIPAGVPGLPAGTYTLLPSEYLLQPGAFRVELDGAARFGAPSAPSINGSYQVAAFTGVSNTAIRSSTPVVATITSGAVARTYSQYNETTYDQFVLNGPAATLFGTPRNYIAADGKYLTLNAPSTGLALTFGGSALFGAAAGGYDGGVIITASNIEIIPAGGTPTAGFASYTDADLNRMGASSLFIGGGVSLGSNVYNPSNIGVSLMLSDSNTNNLVVRSGADLQASAIFLQTDKSGSILIETGATVSSLGKGASSVVTNGDTYAAIDSFGPDNVLAVANGTFFLTASAAATGSITVQDGAMLASDGTVAFSSSGSVSLSEKANYHARNIAFGSASINIGADGAPGATVPAGFSFTQGLLNALLRGDPTTGVPAVQRLALSATNSLNLFGTTSIDASGSGVEIDLNTPAIYGYGGSGDVATIKADTLVWNGISTMQQVPATVGNGTVGVTVSAPPGPVVANGPGTGTGSLAIVANTIVLGVPDTTHPNTAVTLDHLVSGFANVDLAATTEITANGKGSLSVYQTAPTASTSGVGGNLTLTTPLLTTESGAVLALAAGGGVSVQAPAGAAPAATSATKTLGGEIDITGATIAIDSSVALPSGRLQLTADGDITLGGNAAIDVAGRAIAMIDQTEYTFGGDVEMSSAHGNITLTAGSIIDISAVNNAAGTFDITATDAAAGKVILAGAIKGSASGIYDAGGTKVPYEAASIDIRAQQIGDDPNNLSADFAALNSRLDAGGVTGSRAFDLKKGNLVIDGVVTAQHVYVSIDGGSLEVSGLIDASGQQPGTIELAALNDLTLDPSAVLDAHGTVLRVDSYGNPIFSTNRGSVTLTTVNGVLTLSPGATIDMRVTDARNVDAAGNQIVNYGDLELNAPRLGGTGVSATSGVTITDPVDGSVTTGTVAPTNAQGNGIAIQAGGTLNIKGAGSIALNAFATYKNAPADPNDSNGQIIDQAYLDLIDQDSQAFISNIYGGNVGAGVLITGLRAQLGGLLAYQSAFHIRPGVEIDSATPNGDLTVTSAIDLSGYRYGPNANRDTTSPAYGAGEPMNLVIRAGGNMTVNGSISDGFDKPAVTIVKGSPGSPIVGDIPDISKSNFFRSESATDDTGQGQIYAGISSAPTLVVVDDWTIPPVTVFGGLSLYGPDWDGGITSTTGHVYNVGDTIPAGTTIIVRGVDFDTFEGPHLAQSYSPATPDHTIVAPVVTANMLAPGSLSASILLAAGADLSAANTRTLLPASALGSSGNLTLTNTATNSIPDVIRTGAGSLSLLAGGNISVDAPYGVYTAGTQSATIGGTVNNAIDPSNGRNVYDLVTTGFGPAANTWYPDDGGDLLLQAQGDFSGYVHTLGSSGVGADSSAIANWLVRQGDSALGQPTAWGISFGAENPTTQAIFAFTGFGTLGGGNVTVDVGDNAGLVSSINTAAGYSNAIFGGLVIAVGSTGRVVNGQVVETGGGDINIRIGGALNPAPPILGTLQTETLVTNQMPGGTLTDLRGHLDLTAGSVGTMIVQYGVSTSTSIDPRQPDPNMANSASPANNGAALGGVLVAPGDATMQLSARGDLVLEGATDPGRVATVSNAAFSGSNAGFGGIAATDGETVLTGFSLWRPETAVSLFAAGGNLQPFAQLGAQSTPNYTTIAGVYDLPPSFAAIAANGSIFYSPTQGTTGQLDYNTGVELAPSPIGQLEMLAEGSIIAEARIGSGVGLGRVDTSPAGGMPIFISGADPATVSSPFHPADEVVSSSKIVVSQNTAYPTITADAYNYQYLVAFGPDTPTTNLHANDPNPALIYAVTGDIVNLQFGGIATFDNINGAIPGMPSVWYLAAKPARIVAGRDIISTGIAIAGQTLSLSISSNYNAELQTGVILNNNPGDVSVIEAGRNIIYLNQTVAGPGQLVVQAGNTLYEADRGTLTSIGPIVNVDPTNRNSGAGIAVLAGVGAAGPNYASFANAFLNPSDPSALLASGMSDYAQIVQQNDAELANWLQQRFGYGGGAAGAWSYFQTLPAVQQNVFLRQLYFEELNQAGLDFNEPSSTHYRSYVLGRDAIATLFPAQSYSGNITMFGGSGIHTNFGGAIETLTPGGETLIGIEGAAPPSTAGVITQGSGDIDMYSLDSVLLGQSRIMTTFGGNILIWSATGDINAGRGAKTTVIFTPPRRIYDNFGDVTLSPTVPSTGAGIATLNPIPEVPPGNINLIAPLGTIDAGEAGIRVSGNINLAAVQIVNAANIQVQGTTTGLPTVSAPPVAALTSANNTAGAAQQMAPPPAPSNKDQPSIIIVEFLGFGGGDAGDTPVRSQPRQDDTRKNDQRHSEIDGNYDPYNPVHLLGNGELTEKQKRKLSADENSKLEKVMEQSRAQ